MQLLKKADLAGEIGTDMSACRKESEGTAPEGLPDAGAFPDT
jgi:hypothetical protein